MFSPSPEFLSDVAGFEAAAIAIAIPLSLDIVARVSDRYRSGVLASRFMAERVVRLLPVLLLISILSAVALRFSFGNEPTGVAWLVVSATILALFVWTAFELLNFFQVLKKYMTDTERVIEQLLRSAKNLCEEPITQRAFLRASEMYKGLGDILVVDAAERQPLDPISDALSKLRERAIPLLRSDRGQAVTYQSDPATLRKCDLGLVVSHQLIRVHVAAAGSNNYKVAHRAATELTLVLGEVSEAPGNALVVSELLGQVSHGDNESSGASTPQNLSWYVEIVFGNKFEFTYLELFDRYFFAQVARLVTGGHRSVFEACVQRLSSAQYPTYHGGSIWEYDDALFDAVGDWQELRALNERYNLETRVHALQRQMERLETIDARDRWWISFNELKAIVESLVRPDQLERVRRVESDIRSYVEGKFKHGNLVELTFCIGAFCLFKEQAEFIRYLWEYEQPPDADATWIGSSIAPTGLSQVLAIYLSDGIGRKARSLYWEDRHGSNSYFQHYALLLVARGLVARNRGSGGPTNWSEIAIGAYEAEGRSSQELSNHAYRLERLIGRAGWIRDNVPLLRTLGVIQPGENNSIETDVVEFLGAVRSVVGDQLETIQRERPISPQRISEFGHAVVNSFEEASTVRKLFGEFGGFLDQSVLRETQGEDWLGINIIDDKSLFFEEWYVDSSAVGPSYGRSLANSENTRLFELLHRNCTALGLEALGQEMNEASVLLAANLHPADLKIPGWISRRPVEGTSALLEYVRDAHVVPIWSVHDPTIERCVLCMDRRHLGPLVQRYPLIGDDPPECQLGILRVRVDAFSDRPEMLNEILERPPAWLSAIGSAAQQREHLSKKVRIQVGERVELRFEGFAGRVIRLARRER